MQNQPVWQLWLHPGICTNGGNLSTWDRRCNVSSVLRWIGNAKSTSCQRSYLQLVFQHRQSSVSSTCHYGQVSLQTLFQGQPSQCKCSAGKCWTCQSAPGLPFEQGPTKSSVDRNGTNKSTSRSTLIDQSQKTLREITVDHAHEEIAVVKPLDFNPCRAKK